MNFLAQRHPSSSSSAALTAAGTFAALVGWQLGNQRDKPDHPGTDFRPPPLPSVYIEPKPLAGKSSEVQVQKVQSNPTLNPGDSNISATTERLVANTLSEIRNFLENLELGRSSSTSFTSPDLAILRIEIAPPAPTERSDFDAFLRQKITEFASGSLASDMINVDAGRLADQLLPPQHHYRVVFLENRRERSGKRSLKYFEYVTDKPDDFVLAADGLRLVPESFRGVESKPWIDEQDHEPERYKHLVSVIASEQ